MPGIKGPVDGTLVATLNGKADVAKDTSVVILLSIKDNEFCAGNYLQASIEAALKVRKSTNANGLASVTCLVADELQAHNLKSQNTNEEQLSSFREQGIRMGDRYLEDNLPFILQAIANIYPEFKKNDFVNENGKIPIAEQINALNIKTRELKIPFTITRWKEWRTNEGYQLNKDKILPQYDIPRSKLAVALQSAVNSFTDRGKFNGMSADEMKLLKQRSNDYIREESAVIPYMVKALKIDLMAYAGKILPIFGVARSIFDAELDPVESSPLNTLDQPLVKPEPENELKIKFKRVAKSVQPSTRTINSQSNHLDAFNERIINIAPELKQQPLSRSKSEQYISSNQRNGFFFQSINPEPLNVKPVVTPAVTPPEALEVEPLDISKLEALLEFYAKNVHGADSKMVLVQLYLRHVTCLVSRPESPRLVV